ncbi:mechanosensitive ion channel domain-containing protein [Simiduia agarivorans]|uniref:Small-conductance mechanosensitive channel n=1 Tax=Simiduia agarivorans (strain DSM 21679 / JCM 13881 / BCRC 17597 / SA1) TaxID=1117647 RepID=K4KMI2_SIMAS|nr:mechanosensitive ion channel domain-containing protein [Simiduia agarivorans]AFV00217.1 transporter small conductance mechanosensitive ion channel family protein [Simiduia agarivorans SA1 = DSM 21679]
MKPYAVLRPLLVLIVCWCAGLAHAQPTPAGNLLDQALALKLEIEQIAAEAETVDGERKESLALRNTQRYLELLRLYDKLTAQLAAQKQRGEPIDGALNQIRADLLNVGPVISRAIEQRQAVLDKLDKQYTPLSPEWQGAFREQQTFIDNALQALARHIENLNALALNSEQSSQFLREQLPQRAEVLAGLISLTQKDIQTTEQHLSNAPDDTEALVKGRNLQEKLTTITGSLRETVALLEAQSMDTGRYKELLIRTTGDITTDILDAGLIKRLGQAWLDKAFAYVSDNGIAFFFKLVIFVAILVLFHYLSKAARKLLTKSLRKATVPVSSLMEDMLVSMAQRLVMLVGILVALGQLGFSLGPILAGLGVAGFIVGFALQDTLGNFASGMMILIYRPYDVGDLIEAAGVQGRVQRMNLVSTTILTIDNQTLMIPNNKIWGDVIRNVTAQKHRRIDMVFGIGYGDDIDHAEQVLSDIVAQHPKVLDEPELIVKLHTLNESSVDFVVRPWVATDDYWDVYWDITRAVKKRFDAEGISIPFPQRDVHLYPVKADA